MPEESTRQRLFRAAQALILADGYEHVTVRRIAQAAGYTYPLLYHYFRDRDDLFWQLRLDWIETMIAELTPDPDPAEGSADELTRLLVAYAQYYFERPNLFRFFYFQRFQRPENDEASLRLEQRFHAMWQRRLETLVLTGRLAADGAEATARILLYSLHGLILLSLSANGDLSPDAVYQEIGELVNHLWPQKGRSL